MEVLEDETALTCGKESQGRLSYADRKRESLKIILDMYESKFPKAQGNFLGNDRSNNSQSSFRVPTRHNGQISYYMGHQAESSEGYDFNSHIKLTIK